MKSWPTPKYLQICGDPRRCIRCGETYWQVQTRGAQAGEDWRRCPRCVAEILAPKKSFARELVGCVLFASAVASWLMVML